MATREISTRLRLDGEAEYSAALRNIASSMGNFKSEIALLNSQFEGQKNSYDFLVRKSELLRKAQELHAEKVKTYTKALTEAITTEDQYATKANELRKMIEDEKNALENLKKSTEDTTEAQKESEDTIARYEAMLNNMETATAKAANTVTDYSTKLNFAERDLNKLNSELDHTEQYMNEAANSADGYATSIDGAGKKVKGAADDVQSASQAMEALSSAFAAAGVTAGLKKLVDGFQDCAQEAIAFESAIAGVFKTVDGTKQQLQGISDGIQRLSTVIPTTTTELAGIAETAGQLGIATDDVLNFTEVMANMAVATNLSSEDAATQLARFANITGMAATDFERLGSTIVALGNNYATTESEIVAMGMRLASTGTLVKLNEAQIMALATTMSSLGISAEAGGTAISKLMQQFDTMVATGSDKLEQFAKVAGMSADEFAQVWKEDALSAIGLFIDGLGQVDSAGGSVSATLDELGIKQSQQVDAISRLATANGMLTDTVHMAGAAWAENTALTDEAAMRYGTLESKLQLLENSASLLKTAIGDALTPALENLAETGANAFQWMAEFAENNQELVQIIASVVAGLAVLLAGITAFSVVPPILAKVREAWLLFQAALAGTGAGTVAAVIIAITALATAIGVFTNSSQKGSKEVENLKNSFADYREEIEKIKASHKNTSNEIDGLVASFLNLKASSDGTAGYMLALKEITSELTSLIPELSTYVDEETGVLNLSAEAMNAFVDAANRQSEVAEATEIYNESTRKRIELENELAEKQAELHRLEAEGADTTTKLASSREDLNEIYGRGAIAGEGMAETEQTLSAEARALTGAISELETELEEVNSDIVEADGKLQSFGSALTEQATGVSGSVSSLTDLIHQMATLSDAYDAAKNSAKESIEQQLSLWNKMDNQTKITAATLNENILSQITYLENYSANMDSLLSRNIEGIEEFAQNFTDGSAQSAAALAGLKDASDEEIAELIANVRKLDGVGDGWASQMAEMEVGTKDALGAVREEIDALILAMSQDEASAEAGIAIIQSYLDGVSGKSGELNSKMEQIARDAIARLKLAVEGDTSFQAAMEANAREAASGVERVNFTLPFEGGLEKAGKGIEGNTSVSKGLQNNTKKALDAFKAVDFVQPIVSAFTKAGTAVEQNEALPNAAKTNAAKVAENLDDPAIPEAAGNAMDAAADEVAGNTTVASNAKIVAGNAAKSFASAKPQFIQAGRDMISGAINGANSMSASLRSAMARLAAQAIAAFKAALDSNSPSKKFMVIGEDSIEGYIIGLQAKESDAVNAAMASARSVLSAFEGEFKDYKSSLDFALSLDAISMDEYIAALEQALIYYDLINTDLNAYRSVIKEIHSYTADLTEEINKAYEAEAKRTNEAIQKVLDGYLTIQQAADLYNVSVGDVVAEVSFAKYYEQQMGKAVEAVVNGQMSMYEAVKEFGVNIDDLIDASEKHVTESNEDLYKKQRENLKYRYDMGLISTEEYYEALARLRDTFLEEDSAEWRRANVEQYNYYQQMIAQAEKATADKLKSIADKEAAAIKDSEKRWDEWLKNRKQQIKDELAAEKERINSIIDGINAEMQARKNLRSDEDSEDKIVQADAKVRDAEKSLAIAKAEYAHARDDNERIEAEKLVIQKQEALLKAQEAAQKARQDYEDKLWEREKKAEIDAEKAKIKDAEAAAKAAESAAEAEAAQGKLYDKLNIEDTYSRQRSAIESSSSKINELGEKASKAGDGFIEIAHAAKNVTDVFQQMRNSLRQGQGGGSGVTNHVSKTAAINIKPVSPISSGQISNLIFKTLDGM